MSDMPKMATIFIHKKKKGKVPGMYDTVCLIICNAVKRSLCSVGVATGVIQLRLTRRQEEGFEHVKVLNFVDYPAGVKPTGSTSSLP